MPTTPTLGKLQAHRGVGIAHPQSSHPHRQAGGNLKPKVYGNVHFNNLGTPGLGRLPFPKSFPSDADRCGARGRSGVVHHLVGQCNRGAVGEGSWPVPPLQEKGQKFPFAFHKDGASPHKAEAILSKDDLRFFYHLHAENRHRVREEEAETVGRGAFRWLGLMDPDVSVVCRVCRAPP